MLDLIFLVGLAIALYLGYRSGFARALVGFVSIILSAFGGYLFYPAFAVVLMKTPLYERKPQILKYLNATSHCVYGIMVVCLKPLILKTFWT